LFRSFLGWKRNLIAEGIESNPGPKWDDLVSATIANCLEDQSDLDLECLKNHLAIIKKEMTSPAGLIQWEKLRDPTWEPSNTVDTTLLAKLRTVDEHSYGKPQGLVLVVVSYLVVASVSRFVDPSTL